MIPTWNEFAWATFLYGATGYDSVYQDLMKKKQLLKNLRTKPSQLEIDDIKEQIIKGFLNRWKCRIPNTTLQTANALQTTLRNLVPHLQVLDVLTIVNVDFTRRVNVDNNPLTISQVIEYCYTKVRKMGCKFGATATSKLLHIMQPKLFIMWDREILRHYNDKNPQISDSGQGYCAYLERMQQIANQISINFQNANLNPARQTNQDSATYLSTQMNYNPPKTLAKYLDEFNFITITNKVKVPPKWYP